MVQAAVTVSEDVEHQLDAPMLTIGNMQFVAEHRDYHKKSD